MPPVAPAALHRLKPRGLQIFRKRTAEIAELAEKRPPIQAVRRSMQDRRGLIATTDGAYHKRQVSCEDPDNDAHWSTPVPGAIVPPEERVHFVPPADDMAVTPEPSENQDIFRFCTASAAVRASALTGEVSRGSLQLSITTWNAGAFRGFRTSEAFRGGKFHVLLGQEFGSEQEEQQVTPEDRAALDWPWNAWVGQSTGRGTASWPSTRRP
jgi:hypothetical protein